jgi:hypothetical protein
MGGGVSIEKKARNSMCDAVHMKPLGYSLLAEKIKELARAWQSYRQFSKLKLSDVNI